MCVASEGCGGTMEKLERDGVCWFGGGGGWWVDGLRGILEGG